MALAESKNFTNRERAILSHVEKNQGCSRQDVINVIAPSSPVPVYNDINVLIKMGVITEARSPKNKQTRALYTNKENPLIALINNLDDFEESLFRLLDKVRGSGKTHYPMPEGMTSFTSLIDEIVEHFIGMIFLDSLVVWPQEVKNPDVAVRLYDHLFGRLFAISVRLFEAYTKMGLSYINSLTQRFWYLRPHQVRVFQDLSKKFGLEAYAQDTLNQLWKLSRNYAPQMEVYFKVGLMESIRSGQKLKLNEKTFDTLKEWMEYLDQPTVSRAKNKRKLR